MRISLISMAVAGIMAASACRSSKNAFAAAAADAASKPDTYPNLVASYNYETLNANTFKLTTASQDSTYGYTPENPIHVGGARQQQGPSNQRRYLNALLGPNGETITYFRKGSCCHFYTKNGLMGMGLLDQYEVTWENNTTPYILYINMYDAGELKAPKGFTFRQ